MLLGGVVGAVAFVVRMGLASDRPSLLPAAAGAQGRTGVVLEERGVWGLRLQALYVVAAPRAGEDLEVERIRATAPVLPWSAWQFRSLQWQDAGELVVTIGGDGLETMQPSNGCSSPAA